MTIIEYLVKFRGRFYVIFLRLLIIHVLKLQVKRTHIKSTQSSLQFSRSEFEMDLGKGLGSHDTANLQF
jgi:hypothetical protein